MFALEWWVYPLIGCITFVSMWLAYRLEAWQESRRRTSHEHPCLVHVGTSVHGDELYCGRLEGHTEPHGDVVIAGVCGMNLDAQGPTIPEHYSR